MAQPVSAVPLRGSKYSRNAVETLPEPAPRINVRYFYNSPLSIDDTLSHVPAPTTALSHDRSGLLRPFSDFDNTALDQAWILLRQHAGGFARQPHFPLNREQRKRLQHKEQFERPFRSDSLGRNEAVKFQVEEQDISDKQENCSSSTRESSGSLRSDAFIKRHLEVQSLREKETLKQGSDNSSSPDQSTAKLFQEEGDIDTSAAGLAGKPFIRVPSRISTSTLEEQIYPRDGLDRNAARNLADENNAPVMAVPVGIARLHQVHMPKLEMDPIYWSTIHDLYSVIRGTWFYKDTMLPVESDIANLLEMGYLHVRPWMDAWNDELNSAVEVGARGEEKIAHALWSVLATPKLNVDEGPGSMHSFVSLEEDEDPTQIRKRTVDQAGSFIDIASEPNADNKAAGSENLGKDKIAKLYRNASVIYANENEATILRPSLAPSAYYGRRPYANYIRKGFKIGIPVVRGFDSKSFEKRNPKSNDNAYRTTSNDRNTRLSEPQQSQVTDLVLVIHGIGQKLSERVESFHFTHAMNAFRREVNAELYNPIVQANTRQGMGGIMVLPVNWRSTLSFEESEYSDADSNTTKREFSLKDITPAELSSIRNIISDVMLDIPYYLSHHQPKIVSAVVNEANRIYKLWSKNNPDFSEKGRVHLIAHSLGSVIAMDVLSRQPTMINSDDSAKELEATNFVFNTTNIFFCGSPAGFFLLLKRAKLLPRRGRKGGSMAGENGTSTVSGFQHTYGCLAVDNIYNIINPYDPVAYHLNATIDATYASSLKPAYVPKSSASWFSWVRAGGGNKSASASKRPNPPGFIQRLPSNVELEIHDFSQEEIAEQRAYLLNDNGQVDYLLHYGGGPLDIQYLTMLSAHSSYWISKDFVRFVVLETSRRPGPDGVLSEMKAAKKKAFVA